MERATSPPYQICQSRMGTFSERWSWNSVTAAADTVAMCQWQVVSCSHTNCIIKIQLATKSKGQQEDNMAKIIEYLLITGSKQIKSSQRDNLLPCSRLLTALHPPQKKSERNNFLLYSNFKSWPRITLPQKPSECFLTLTSATINLPQPLHPAPSRTAEWSA